MSLTLGSKVLVKVVSNDGDVAVLERHDGVRGRAERSQHPGMGREQFLAWFPLEKIHEGTITGLPKA